MLSRDESEILSDTRVSVGRLEVAVEGLQDQITKLVTKAEFTPVKLIAYGLATTLMGSVVTAIVAKVIVK